MTDRELLELAAKAAGIEGEWGDVELPGGEGIWYGFTCWNPLYNDGDALRLAVKLELSVYAHHKMVNVTHTMKSFCELEIIEDYPKDPYAATRRAIVRAAAELGKGMK